MAGKLKIAFWLETDSQHACEIAARTGYDIVILDMEHGVLGVREDGQLDVELVAVPKAIFAAGGSRLY